MIINWERFISKMPLVFNRRQVLTSMFASSAAVLAVGSKPAAVITPAHAAETLDRAMLIQMGKDIYPHDGFLDDKPYEDTIDGIIKEAEGDEKVKSLIENGLSDLNARAQKIHGKSYSEVDSYGAREALLRQIELSDFFQKVRGGLLFGIYNNKSLFPKFGYGGSSWEHGGYIDRGFSDMTWLPDDPRKNGGNE